MTAPVRRFGAAPSEVRLLLGARALRAFGDGLVSLLLPVHLARLGFDAVQIGALVTATLAGSAVLTLGVGLYAYRFPTRTLLLCAGVLMIGTGLLVPLADGFRPLFLIALVGTLNPSSGDVSVFLPLEQARLAQAVPDHGRTGLFARYSLIGSLSAAFGALCAGAPEILAAAAGIDTGTAVEGAFVLYALLGVASLLLYRRLPPAPAKAAPTDAAPLRESRGVVLRLAALFSLDSFAGGLVVQSLLALWLFERFGLSLAVAGAVFFWTGVLSAFSYLAAVRIAARIGLVNTMVFTHLPANVCLLLVPFSPGPGTAIALLLVRSLLSQMDVPTRTSYVMAVVTPGERAAAAGVTAVPRSLAAALGPLLAGHLLAASGFGWPLVLGGGLKIAYDLLLLGMFRNVRPPEEAGGRTGGGVMEKSS